jgi:O-antigen/teichoic acid export membrane protein
LSVFKNYFFSLSLQVINILTPLITLPIIVNSLGKGGMGKIAIVGSVMSYFIIFGSSGLTSFGNKVIAKSDDNLDLTIKFNKIFTIQFIYTTISIFFFLLYIPLFGFDLKEIFLVSVLQLVAAYFDFTWFFYGINEIRTLAIRNIAVKLLGIISIYLFIKTTNDLNKYFWIISLSNLFANLLLLYVLKKKINYIDLKWNFKDIKRDFLTSFWVLLPLLIMTIYSNIDRYIIYFFLKNYESVGVYDISIKIISIVAILIIACRPIIISKISSLNNKDFIVDIVNKSLSLVFYISIPIIVLLYVNIEVFINLFLSNKFVESATIVKILSIQILFTGIGDVLVNQVLISIGKEKIVIGIISILCFLLIALYIVLIPTLGIKGAAISSVFAHLFILFVEFYYVNKYLKLKISLVEIIKVFISGALMLVFSMVVYNLININSYSRLAIFTILAVFIYLSSCLIFKNKMQTYILSKII